MAKPDNRSDNVSHLQQHIDDTMENIRDTRDYLKAHSDELDAGERQNLTAKNERRERAIQGFREEIRDEANHEFDGDSR